MNKLLIITTICSAVFSNQVLASGFQLYEQSASGVGNYRAGGSASANEASTAFFNAAGLTELHNKEFSITTVAVNTAADFTGSAEVSHIQGFQGNAPTQSTSITGRNLVPSVQAVYPINEKWSYGFDISVPFGLSTEWDRNSFVSYAASESSIETINIGNSVGYAVNDRLSLGFGADVQHLKGIFNLQGDIFNTFEVAATNKVTGWGYGWHVGALYKFNTNTRVGFSYRSPVHHNGTGPSSTVCNKGDCEGLHVESHHSTAEVDVKLPASAILSYFHQFNNNFDMMASLYFTQWSTIKKLELKNSATMTDPETITTPTNYKDAYSIALGLNYHVNSKWLVTAGTGYDQTPTNDRDRDLRLPDNDRLALSVGTSYSPSNHMKFTLGFTQLFIKKVPINSVSDGSSVQKTQVIGKVDGSASIVGLQFSYKV